MGGVALDLALELFAETVLGDERDEGQGSFTASGVGLSPSRDSAAALSEAPALLPACASAELPLQQPVLGDRTARLDDLLGRDRDRLRHALFGLRCLA